MKTLLATIKRSLAVANLTHKHWRASQVTPATAYHFNGHSQKIHGDSIISLLTNVILEDCYGMKRFQNLATIVDVGANAGVFAINSATLFPAAKIHAYEPFAENYTNLQANTSSFPNITTYLEAVGSSSRQVHIEDQADRSACYIIEPAPQKEGIVEGQTCTMIGLGTVIERAGGAVDLLKLDCEGSEYEIIKAAELDDVHFIAGEFHTCPMGTPTQGLEILKERGFFIDHWNPFLDGKAGDFWASNSRNGAKENALLKPIK